MARLLALAFLVGLGSNTPGHAQGTGQVVLSVPNVTAVQAPSQTPLAVSISPVSALPKNAFLRLRGLPPMAALTEGYAIGPGSWAVSLAAAPNLKVSVPVGAEGRADIAISLVSIDGVVLAEAQTTLVIGRVPPTATASQPPAASIMRTAPLDPLPPPTRPSMTPAELERAQRLFKRGEDHLKEANVSEARLFFERAADVGLAEAALALGATYETAELEKLNIRGAQADDAQARRWYERAAQLGAAEARQRLQRLGGR